MGLFTNKKKEEQEKEQKRELEAKKEKEERIKLLDEILKVDQSDFLKFLSITNKLRENSRWYYFTEIDILGCYSITKKNKDILNFIGYAHPIAIKRVRKRQLQYEDEYIIAMRNKLDEAFRAAHFRYQENRLIIEILKILEKKHKNEIQF